MPESKEGSKQRYVFLNEEEWELIDNFRKTGTLPDSHLLQSDLNAVKIKERNLQLKDRYKKLLRELEVANQRLEHLSELRGIPASSQTIVPDSQANGLPDAAAIMVAGDWHVEERVDPQTVNDMNDYGLEEAERRAIEFFKNGLRKVRVLRNGYNIRTLVLAVLGDIISGYIHEELLENNLLSPVEASRLAKKFICAGINYLLKNGQFDVIRVVCCFGNHGRTSQRKKFATGYKNSYEWLLYHSIADAFERNKRVEFVIATGYHVYDTLFDRYTIRYHHGDEIKYRGGVGGMTIPVNKAIAKWNSIRPAYLDIFGHFHETVDGGQFVANGSLIGYNAYAISIKAQFQEPKQSLILIEKERGKSFVAPIHVTKQPVRIAPIGAK